MFGQIIDSTKITQYDSLDIFKEYQNNLSEKGVIGKKSGILFYGGSINSQFGTYFKANNFKKNIHTSNINLSYFRKMGTVGDIHIFWGLSGGTTRLWFNDYDTSIMQEKTESFLFPKANIFVRLTQQISNRAFFFFHVGPSYHYGLRRKIRFENSDENIEEKKIGHFYATFATIGFEFKVGRLFYIGVGMNSEKSFQSTIIINGEKAKFSNTYLLTSVKISFE